VHSGCAALKFFFIRTKGLIENVRFFEITKKIFWICLVVCNVRVVGCYVRVVFHSVFSALNQISGLGWIGRHNMLACPEFTVSNSLFIFEKHKVFNLLIDSRVINQWECFFWISVAVWLWLRPFSGLRSVAWNFFSEIKIIGIVIAFYLNLDWLGLSLSFFRIFMELWESACYFICSTN